MLTYVTNSWGNKAEPCTEGEVRTGRARTRLPTFAALEAVAKYSPYRSHSRL